MTSEQLLQRLVAIAADRYRSSGRFAYFFARSKLRGDPVFASLLASGPIPDGARILDLGCGQGLLSAWLDAARRSYEAGEWVDTWPPAPRARSIVGIDLMPRDVDRARRALGTLARIEVGDVREADYGEADVVTILDVLHYMDRADQELVLRRVRASIGSAGLLLLRVGDAGGGLRFWAARSVDTAVQLIRGYGSKRTYCRTLPEWFAVLTAAGFTTQAIPMSAGTPFANVLFVAAPR